MVTTLKLFILVLLDKSYNPTFELFWMLKGYNTIYLVLRKLCDKGNEVWFNSRKLCEKGIEVWFNSSIYKIIKTRKQISFSSSKIFSKVFNTVTIKEYIQITFNEISSQANK